MPPVFGRPLPSPHPYDDALFYWLMTSVPEERALAMNIMHDHRVSVEREASFDRFVKKPCNATTFKRGVDEYFKTKVRERVLPEYVYERVNGNNILNGKITIPPQVNKDRRLVRVVNLNRLSGVFQWAKGTGRWKGTFRWFPGPHNEKAVMGWLSDNCKRGVVRGFLGVVLDVLNSYRKESPFQPTWTTTLDAFQPHVPGGPDRWLQVLGVAKPRPSWVIILCYPLREAGTVARPTQLDGGWYSHHFPSPPATPLGTGGHPMDLRVAPRANQLLPEFIHKQIEHPIDHWDYLGGLYGLTTDYPSAGIIRQRRCHFRLLVKTYGPSVFGWMSSST